MLRPQIHHVPHFPDVESRSGIRAAFKSTWKYLEVFFESDYRFKNDVFSELTPLYAELDETPGLLANGAQRTVTITVTGAIPGYEVNATYNQDLQNLIMGVPYVSALNTVEIILFNSTGAGVTLAAGRWRVYVKPKLLTS